VSGAASDVLAARYSDNTTSTFISEPWLNGNPITHRTFSVTDVREAVFMHAPHRQF
jgi:hypothetical protein